MLRKIRQKYHLRIPSKVRMADYNDKEGDLYIRFREVKHTEGEPTDDGLVIVHRNVENRTVAIEVLNLVELWPELLVN
ncbi:MAG: hypothetical protein ACE5KU_00080 [Nitrososphaerales archaeon]